MDAQGMNAQRLIGLNWVKLAVRRYADFSGRSRRKEYWYFTLYYVVVYVSLLALDGATGLIDDRGRTGVFSAVFSVLTVVPALAVTVRRLHDTGRRGWWMLLSLVPIGGPVAMLIFLCRKSQPGVNAFGDEPLLGTEFSTAQEVV